DVAPRPHPHSGGDPRVRRGDARRASLLARRPPGQGQRAQRLARAAAAQPPGGRDRSGRRGLPDRRWRGRRDRAVPPL
ncbi:MAG: hypothetical protein AVDCRST_MAG17-1697, partial [uncultured Solirubrobacterales bacterium]